VTVDVGELWQRLSPRMLLVHPVHEVLRQIPLLNRVGGARLGDRQSDVDLFGLALVVGYGVARWFTTTYRIDTNRFSCALVCSGAMFFRCAQQDSLGVDRRAAVAPVARVTVLRVSTGQEAKGDTAFALDAVQPSRCLG